MDRLDVMMMIMINRQNLTLYRKDENSKIQIKSHVNKIRPLYKYWKKRFIELSSRAFIKRQIHQVTKMKIIDFLDKILKSCRN